MKNRTPEQAVKHREYMKEYYRKNSDKRITNTKRSNKRGLEKIACIQCAKHITRVNMKRHVITKHISKTKNGILLNELTNNTPVLYNTNYV